MSIALGLNSLTDIKFGSNQVSSVYIGTNLVWSSYSYILDLYPTSIHHAYSLRKLSSTYTGACLRVRRTTTTPTVTTTTVDLSFDVNNTISFNSAITYVSGTVTLATNLGQFAASTTNPDGVNTNQSIFVVTWFDQSGNGKNPTMATASNQPRLVNAGTLETKDSKVAVRFVRASVTRLFLTDTSMNINNLSQYIVTSLITTNVATNFSAFRYTTNSWWLPFSNGTSTYINYNTSGATSGFFCQTNDTVNRLYSMVAGALTTTGYKGTTSLGSVSSVSVVTSYITLGYSGGGATNALDGYIQESITWQNQSNVPNIQSNIMTYYGL